MKTQTLRFDRCLISTAGLAALLLTGCATRPPRELGPPGPVTMPPAEPATDDLPPAVEVEVTHSVQPERPEPAPAPSRKLEPRAGEPYTVKKGETLSGIAARNGMGWRRLAEYNYLTNPDQLRAGQVILIPPGSSTPSRRSGASNQVQPPPAPLAGGRGYVVRSGDSLSVIAQRHGTSVRELKQVNDLVSDRLLVGQVLKLPEGAGPRNGSASGGGTQARTRDPRPTPEPTRPVPTPIPGDLDVEVPLDEVPEEVEAPDQDPVIDKAFPIVVQEGDTLESIASDYIVSVKAIRERNNLPAGTVLEPGQKLLIPPSVY